MGHAIIAIYCLYNGAKPEEGNLDAHGQLLGSPWFILAFLPWRRLRNSERMQPVTGRFALNLAGPRWSQKIRRLVMAVNFQWCPKFVSRKKGAPEDPNVASFKGLIGPNVPRQRMLQQKSRKAFQLHECGNAGQFGPAASEKPVGLSAWRCVLCHPTCEHFKNPKG